jgi:adenylosuccinate lyase
MFTALDNVTLWHERDISHSSAERIILPDSTIALDYLLDKMTFVISGLHIYPESMLNNINKTGGLFFSQSLLLAIIDKNISREDAYRMVQNNAMRAWNGEGSLKDLVMHDSEINNLFSSKEIDEIFDMNKYFENIQAVFNKTGINE